MMMRNVSNNHGTLKTKRSVTKPSIDWDANEIIAKVSQRTDISLAQMIGPTRPDEITLARHVCFFLLRLKGWDYNSISTFFGRTHAAAMSGCLRINLRFDTEPKFQAFWPEYAEFRVAHPRYEPLERE